MGMSPFQLGVILLIVILVFGTKKLRNMGGDLGGAIKNFKKGIKDDEPESDNGQPEITDDSSKSSSESTQKVDSKDA